MQFTIRRGGERGAGVCLERGRREAERGGRARLSGFIWQTWNVEQNCCLRKRNTLAFGDLLLMQFHYQDRYLLLSSIHSRFRRHNQVEISTLSLNPRYSTDTPVANRPATRSLVEVTICRCRRVWMRLSQCAKTRYAPRVSSTPTFTDRVPNGQLVTQPKKEKKTHTHGTIGAKKKAKLMIFEFILVVSFLSFLRFFFEKLIPRVF